MAQTGNAEYGVLARLLDTAAVTALVGDRIYMRIAPQNPTVPYLVFTVMAGGESYVHAGGPADFKKENVSIVSVGATQTASRELATEVEKALHGQRGTWGDEDIRGAFRVSSFDRSQQPTEDDEIGFPAWQSTFSVSLKVPLE